MLQQPKEGAIHPKACDDGNAPWAEVILPDDKEAAVVDMSPQPALVVNSTAAACLAEPTHSQKIYRHLCDYGPVMPSEKAPSGHKIAVLVNGSAGGWLS